MRLLLLILTIAGSGIGVSAQVADARFTPSEDFNIDSTFFKMPSGRPVGSTAGISMHPDGSSLWLFDRCGALSLIHI